MGKGFSKKSLFFGFIFIIVLNLFFACSVSAANFPLEIVRPASGIGDNDRVYKAYPGIEYEIRAAVFGGMFPFEYSLSNEPEGMAIDFSTGVISWTPDSVEQNANNIQLSVTDAEGTTVTSIWSIDVTEQGFYFVNKSATDGGDGSLNNPWNDWGDFYLGNDDSTYDDGIIYFFNGNYTYPSEYTGSTAGSSNRLAIENNHPNVYLAYPGQNEVYFDGEKDSNRIHLHVRTTNAYFKDINFRNGYGFFLEITGGDYQRILDCSFKENNGSGSRSNQGAISVRGDALIQEEPPESDDSFKIYPVIQGCTFENSYQNEIGVGELYGVKYMVIEDNSFKDLANFGVGVKSTTDKVIIRNNTFDTSNGIGVFAQYYAHNTDISFNLIDSETALRLGSYPHNTGPINIYRNTVLGHFYFRSIEEGFGPFNISNNVVVNSDSFSGEYSQVRHLPEDHWSIDVDVANFKDNIMDYPEENIVDSLTGKLTSEYSEYRGSYGWEVVRDLESTNSEKKIYFNDTLDWSTGSWSDHGYGYVADSWTKYAEGGLEDSGYAMAEAAHYQNFVIPIPDERLELYVRFYSKVVNSSAGQKWLKIFDSSSRNDCYAQTTFGRVYETGYFTGVSFGSDCCECDTQKTINYDTEWFPDSEWKYYEAHIKFAQEPEWNNGELGVWYGDEIKLLADNVNNRNSQHSGHISHISIGEYCNTPWDSNLGELWIDDVIVSDSYIGPRECPEGLIEYSCYCGSEPTQSDLSTVYESGYCCDNVWNEGPCSSQPWQTHPADTNPQDGVVSFTEIEAYMNRWLNGEISIDDLLSGVNEWRGLN